MEQPGLVPTAVVVRLPYRGDGISHVARRGNRRRGIGGDREVVHPDEPDQQPGDDDGEHQRPRPPQPGPPRHDRQVTRSTPGQPAGAPKGRLVATPEGRRVAASVAATRSDRFSALLDAVPADQRARVLDAIRLLTAAARSTGDTP